MFGIELNDWKGLVIVGVAIFVVLSAVGWLRKGK